MCPYVLTEITEKQLEEIRWPAMHFDARPVRSSGLAGIGPS